MKIKRFAIAVGRMYVAPIRLHGGYCLTPVKEDAWVFFENCGAIGWIINHHDIHGAKVVRL